VSAAVPGPDGDLLDRYRARVGAGVDELVGTSGIRPGHAQVAVALEAMGLGGLLAARAEARRLVHDDGIHYGGAMVSEPSPGVPLTSSPGAGTLPEDSHAWRLDPVPVVLDFAQWVRLSHGLEQRAVVLDALLADAYGPRRFVREGLVPPEVILGHPGFLRAADGVRMIPGDRQLVLVATDLARDAAGNWTVFADRTGNPSGSGYAMANRRITTRVMASLHRAHSLSRMRGFFHAMGDALQEISPTGADVPRVVLLSPGTASETGYEQGFLATLLGFPLVEAEDLTVRDASVWLRVGDRTDRVDVVLRRVDADWCDPLDLRPESQLGLPGFVEATRLGHLAVANPLGAGLLENAGLLPFLPGVARAVLGTDLELPVAQTWWCGDDASRSHVLAALDQLVIKPIARGVASATRYGWLLSSAERAALAGRIAAEPWRWVGQEPLPMSTTPVVTLRGLEPRRFVLRTFGVLARGSYTFLPGGLGRVGADMDAHVVANRVGALAKDVWVLAPDKPELTSIESAGASSLRVIRAPRSRGTAPRVADNLFWAGRYLERAEGTTRLLRVTGDLVEDHGSRPGTPGFATMTALLGATAAVTGRAMPGAGGTDLTGRLDWLRDLVTDGWAPGTLAFAAGRFRAAAREVRDQLASDVWNVLGRIERLLAELPPDARQIQPHLLDLQGAYLAVAGVLAESMMRDATFGFLDAGVRIERAHLTVRLLWSTVAVERSTVVDGQVAEAVLDVGESIITHRRRAVAGDGPVRPVASALALLLTEPVNPRSVLWQLRRLADDLVLIEDSELAARTRGLIGQLAGADVEALASDHAALAATVGSLDADLQELAASIAEQHFQRKAPQRQLLHYWAPAWEKP
jgi:uncharacterized circularly permuted ATP-grasp superfamily protein/uncharacterized alpha-E superfamily protein